MSTPSRSEGRPVSSRAARDRAGSPLGRAALALPWLVLLAATPAAAGDGGANKANLAALLVTIAIVTFLVYPAGLALHWLIAASLPQRSKVMAHDLAGNFWRTLVLGVLNTGVLLGLFLALAPRGKAGGAAALLVGLVFLVLAFLGLHAHARNVGERLLGEKSGLPARLAAGWFVLLYVSCLPIIGWGLGAFWIVRGVGGVMLSIFGTPATGGAAFSGGAGGQR